MSTRSEQLARSILAGDALAVRSAAQDWLRSSPILGREPAPQSSDPELRAVAAGVVELLCTRTGQTPPSWVISTGAAPRPVFLVEAAHRSPKLRARVQLESPEPLRKRNVFAPPGYLEMI